MLLKFYVLSMHPLTGKSMLVGGGISSLILGHGSKKPTADEVSVRKRSLYCFETGVPETMQARLLIIMMWQIVT